MSEDPKQTVMHGANETGLRHRSDAFVVRVFGGVALSRRGEPVELGGGRQRRLLAALVVWPRRCGRSRSSGSSGPI